jgi:hypothetical protein
VLRSLSALGGGARAYSQRVHRERERELSEQAEAAYRRLVADWQATAPTRSPPGLDFLSVRKLHEHFTAPAS